MPRCRDRRASIRSSLETSAALWLLLAGPVLAQPVAGASGFDGDRYDRAVLAYRNGQAEDSVRALAALTIDDFTALRRWWDAGDLPKRRFTSEDVLASAGMLHTDCALALYERGAPELAEKHLRLASELVRASRRSPALPDGFLGRWYLAAVFILHGHGRFEMAALYLDSALARWPDDVALLVARGAVEEIWATWPAARPGLMDSARRLRDDHLTKAARALERAVALDASRTEALVRLANVRIERGDFKEARDVLESVAASTPAPQFAYLANLLLGGLDERGGRLDDAVARYRAAIDAYPHSQCARTALAAALRRQGRAPEALAVVRESLAVRFDGTAADPWWAYLGGQLQPLDELMAWLREESRR